MVNIQTHTWIFSVLSFCSSLSYDTLTEFICFPSSLAFWSSVKRKKTGSFFITWCEFYWYHTSSHPRVIHHLLQHHYSKTWIPPVIFFSPLHLPDESWSSETAFSAHLPKPNEMSFLFREKKRKRNQLCALLIRPRWHSRCCSSFSWLFSSSFSLARLPTSSVSVRLDSSSCEDCDRTEANPSKQRHRESTLLLVQIQWVGCRFLHL